MPVYNFKKMASVPSSTDLIDIVLTRTQRRTPTVVHPGYKITRIRSFYMRKIKFTQQTISERLGAILTDFPRLNDIHPFYADLCNTLYDRDHYKLALGQINTAQSLVHAISRDMIRMVKYGDSLYRCKCLKRAALGRMCTVLKRLKASLAYLEEVRKHMSRLPALDPNTRTILLCGFPNVGKSSFMNKITRANVDVQPYAFTTKSLFVGHTDYRYLRWQVIDTPGILDHPLEERNTIEMQAVTALAHLTCSVLYFIDISEQCGYPIEQQCSLFQSIKPLFANKQLILVVNKVDQQPWDTLEQDKKNLIQALAKDANHCTLMFMSNISEQGVSDVKAAACDKLLAARVDARISGGGGGGLPGNSSISKKSNLDSIMNRLQVIYPTPRDNIVRDVCIPQSVLRAQQQQQETTMEVGNNNSKDRDNENDDHKPRRSKTGYAPTVKDSSSDDVDMMIGGDGSSTVMKKTARDLMWEHGGPGVWAPDYREQYDLANEDWKFDAIPEILDGKNVADFIDPDIQAKLDELEREEEQLMAELEAAGMGTNDNNNNDNESDLDSEEEAAVEAIRERKKAIRMMSRVNQTQNKPILPREIRGRAKDKHNPGALNEKVIKETMDSLGVDASKMIERGRSMERGRKRERSLSRAHAAKTQLKDYHDDGDDNEEDVEMEDVSKSSSKGQVKKAKKERSASVRRELSLARSHSRPREPSQDGLRDKSMVSVAKKLEREGHKAWHGASGEGDHRKSVHLVKWMNTGKKRNGTHYCR